jgi:hypothetical protein
MGKIMPLLLVCVATRCLAGNLDRVEFDSPANAPIYVIDGDIYYNESVNGVSVSLDWDSTMDPATGSLKGGGPFTMNGSFNSVAIDWAGTIGADMNVKVAGSAVRVNGKLNMNGSGTISGYTLDRLSLLYTFSNLDVNAQTGQMAGYVSLKGSAKLYGVNRSFSLPRTYLAFDLPDGDMNGEWDNSMGDWKISNIDATVDGKGKITGTGEFAVLDDAGDPYDVIDQKISGTVKNGVANLIATGNSKATSKIKVILTYRESDDQTVAKKSSVSAYGQSRKF